MKSNTDMSLIKEFQREFEGFSYNMGTQGKSSIVSRDSKSIRNSEGPGNMRDSMRESTLSMDLSIPEAKENEEALE